MLFDENSASFPVLNLSNFIYSLLQQIFFVVCQHNVIEEMSQKASGCAGPIQLKSEVFIL